MNSGIALVTGNANSKLAQEIARGLSVPIDTDDVSKFSDGETQISIKQNMRGKDVFVIQPTCNNDSLVELLLLLHTLRLASAKRITCVVPYYGYARQDRKTKSRTPISAAAVATLIESMKPHRILTIDLHCGQIQGFFRNIPVDHLSAEDLFVKYLEKYKHEDCVIISPDAGGIQRAATIADKLNQKDVVTIIKRRNSDTGQIDAMQLMGDDVKDQCCIIIDDIIGTAGTLIKATNLLYDHGASKVIAMATHGVFSGQALERINTSSITSVCVTDSIPQAANMEQCSKLEVIPLAGLLSVAIHHIHNELSLSVLFKKN